MPSTIIPKTTMARQRDCVLLLCWADVPGPGVNCMVKAHPKNMKAPASSTQFQRPRTSLPAAMFAITSIAININATHMGQGLDRWLLNG